MFKESPMFKGTLMVIAEALSAAQAVVRPWHAPTAGTAPTESDHATEHRFTRSVAERTPGPAREGEGDAGS